MRFRKLEFIRYDFCNLHACNCCCKSFVPFDIGLYFNLVTSANNCNLNNKIDFWSCFVSTSMSRRHCPAYMSSRHSSNWISKSSTSTKPYNKRRMQLKNKIFIKRILLWWGIRLKMLPFYNPFSELVYVYCSKRDRHRPNTNQ